MGKMSNNNFSSITDKKVRNLYEFMWGDTSRIPGGAEGICETWSVYRKQVKKSKRSYSFRINDLADDNKELVTKIIDNKTKKKICEQLIKTFNIKNKKQFEEKFSEACDGNGKEAANLIRLHSSALCALLFFYNIFHKDEKKINNEITIEIDGKLVTFNNVFFEYKNNVVDKNHPSNIDIVLISKKGDIILFLESKFAEYYLDYGPIEVSRAYRDDETIKQRYYNELFLNNFGFRGVDDFKIFKNKNNTEVFKIDSKVSDKTGSKSYIGGIKQMISHYIGIENFINNDNADPRSEILRKKLSENYQVYLGEILFDFDNDDIKKFREDYEKKYEKLIELLNESSINTSKTKIRCLSKVKYYSDLKEFVNPTIKKFYFGE